MNVEADEAGLKQLQVIPTTLVQFLSELRSPARAFLKGLVKRPELTQEDLSRGRQIVQDQPELLALVVDLARAITDSD